MTEQAEAQSSRLGARVLVILAGGQSRRMGRDKATLRLNGVRMIDRVIGRLAAMDVEIVLSSANDFGLDRPFFPDGVDGIKGPAAGLRAALDWLTQKRPGLSGFYTAPVDAPFLPTDLVIRLAAAKRSAIAVTPSGPHPTCAYWALSDLRAAFDGLPAGASPSLKSIAKRCAADHVAFVDEAAFANINTLDDVEAAQRLLADERRN